MNLLELRRKRAAKIAALRQLLDGAEAEKRGLNEQETSDYEQLQTDIEGLDSDIARRERLDELEGTINDAPTQPDPEAGNIGMSDEEVREYSLVRAIRAAANNDWREAGLEQEASEAVAARMGMEPQGFYVPNDFLMGGQRDLEVQTPTAGGNTVATDLLSGSFISLLRNRLALTSLGVRMLTGLEGFITIPRQTGGGTAYWVGEHGSPTESQQTIDQIGLTPHTLGAFTDFSRRLIIQSSISVENFVREDLARVIGLAIDYAGIHGDSGVDANQPDGLAGLTGVGSVAAGGAPSWDDIINLETEVAADNADIGSIAYLTNAKVRGKLKRTQKFTGTNGDPIWDMGGTPLNGYRAVVSNQVRSDLGAGTDSALFFGNWNDMLMGLWSGLDVMVDPYTHSTSGTMRVVMLQDIDYAFRHPESFSAAVDVDTV